MIRIERYGWLKWWFVVILIVAASGLSGWVGSDYGVSLGYQKVLDAGYITPRELYQLKAHPGEELYQATWETGHHLGTYEIVLWAESLEDALRKFPVEFLNWWPTDPEGRAWIIPMDDVTIVRRLPNE